MGGFLILLITGALYFLPTLIARGKRNATAIFWLNLLGGWTGLGWLIAFIWALTKDTAPVAVAVLSPPAAVARIAPAPVATRVAMPAPAATQIATPAPAVMQAVSSTATRATTLTPAPNDTAESQAAIIATTPASAVESIAMSVAQELERLFNLKEKGALTEEEYIARKIKLLA
ncbi:superinfection immunity protein [Hymenobacter sp. HMF4947]|uniref:Superinfection immunity protein n=2 Tax=Hymenobacter ginkgonis TaxID=2682976 RepID=A0A7K1TIB7_9BACT|nr:superinfection immunity protein [Hymenobacter ginkgonis]